MSLSANDRKISYLGNNTTTTFSYDFRILNESHLRVVAVDSLGNETLLTLATDYTVSGVGGGTGGTITLVDADQDWLDPIGNGLKTGYSIYIFGNTPTTQETDIRNQGPYYPSLHEDAFDKNTMILQEMSEKLRRALLFPSSSSNLDKVMPNPALNNILIWDGSGNLVNLPLSSIASGTYTGAALSLPSLSHTSGTLNIQANATYSSIYCSGLSAKTITLPTAASAGAGRVFLIYNDGNSSVTTVSRSGSDTIEGSTSLSMNVAYKWVCFVSDGVSMWHHNIPKQQEIKSGMIGDREVGAGKWLLTNTSTQTSTFTAALSVGYYPCNTTSGNFTANLPSSITAFGKVFAFENIGTANALTIDASGSQTIEGALTQTLYPGESILIVSDGVNWRTLAFRSRYIRVVTSGQKTPAANNHWHALTGNSFTLETGLWEIDLYAFFSNNGSTPAYTYAGVGLYGANGADSSSQPAALSTVANLTVKSATISGADVAAAYNSSATPTQILSGGKYIVEVTGTSGTIFIVTYATLTTAANARVTASATIKRIGG